MAQTLRYQEAKSFLQIIKIQIFECFAGESSLKYEGKIRNGKRN
jgi:hypothetical protein